MKIATVFKNSCTALILSFVLLAANPVSALVHTEVDDAGITVETAQHLPVGTETVFGALAADDGADVYRFIWGGGTFSANTFGSGFDTMLSIFDLSGELLAFNDEFRVDSLVSLVSSELAAGTYLLGVTYYDNNFGGDIDGYSNFGLEAPYLLNLTASTSVPEPVSLVLVAIGLLALAFIRRSATETS